MINLTCKTCGSNNFKEEKNSYICQYCHATIIKHPPHPNKRLKIIIVLLILILLGGYMVYKLLYSVKDDINHLKQTHMESKENLNVAQILHGDDEKNPFSSLIQQVESRYEKNNTKETLEKAIRRYHTYESNKAFYLAITAKGSYVYGFSYAAKSTKKAEDTALKFCEKERKLNNIKALCIPYAINDHVSSLLIDTL